MKKHYIFLVLILCSIYMVGQTKGIVYYGQKESLSLKGPYGPDFNSYLVFNNEQSLYVTAKDSLDKNTNFKSSYDNQDGTVALAYAVYTTPYGRQVFYDKKKDSLYWNQWKDFYVAEKTPKIDWKLEKETKKIGNFTAHKATGFFRGRTYTAWYTLEIPLPYGPWKLQGLPGLILEAYDTDKEMYLYFKSLEYPTKTTVSVSQIKRPQSHPKTWKSLQDFKEKLNKMYENMKNGSIIIAERTGAAVPEESIRREVFLESF